MSSAFKTPDVYVQEISVFPPSVAEVGTAIPAFVGYTEKARGSDGKNLTNEPTKVRSLVEYEAWFGGAQAESLDIKIVAEVEDIIDESTGAARVVDAKTQKRVTGYKLESPGSLRSFYPVFVMPWTIRAYFENGGAECVVVSVGEFGEEEGATKVEASALREGLDRVAREDEPTLLVIPDAQALKVAEYKDIASRALLQCGDLKDRFAILDAHLGPISDPDKIKLELEDAREAVASEHLKYGAVYHPPLRTTYSFAIDASEVEVSFALPKGVAKEQLNAKHFPDAGGKQPLAKLESGIPKEGDADAIPPNTALASFVRGKLSEYYAVLPPSGAVAGVYAATDAARGVWKAPANVSVVGVLEPAERISGRQQEAYNVDPTTGKSINVLRAFPGFGTKVWGARTLAGNDNEWRYVSVRRFFNMVEESIKKSTYWAVFEPNDANTWVKVRGMIENYLIDKWRDGALAGATPKDAFFVKCGLGTTMNAQDILNGRLNVEIGMAVVRPAEFIVLKFSHKLQVS